MDAIKLANDKNVLFVSIMGNFQNAPGDTRDKITYPAVYWRTMAVGATDINDNVTSFSRRGSHISVVAPGQGIFSALRDGSYGTGNGTSFAAPHVSGLAGLLIRQFPSMTPTDLRYRIEDTADYLPGQTGFDYDRGWGRINADKATQILYSTQGYPETVNNPNTQPSHQIFVSIPAWPVALLPEDTLFNRGDDVARMFPGANAQVAWFDPVSNGYLSYGDSRTPRFGPGKAYIVILSNPVDTGYNACLPFQKADHLFPVHLKPGFNGIGVPGHNVITWNPNTFYVATNADNPSDQTRNGMEDKRTLQAAAQAGWIDPVMHRFDPTAPSGGNNWPAINVGDPMVPGLGYLIRVYRECDILIPSN